jgi:hypothetical protein
MTGVPQTSASIVTIPNGFGQRIGMTSPSAPANRAFFSAAADLTDEANELPVDMRLDVP